LNRFWHPATGQTWFFPGPPTAGEEDGTTVEPDDVVVAMPQSLLLPASEPAEEEVGEEAPPCGCW